jgi:PAS domain-containing protein
MMYPQAAPVRLFFDQTPDEHFLVLTEILSPGAPSLPGEFSVNTFEHEDRFLERVGTADLPLPEIALLASTVIRSVATSTRELNWVELTLTEEQILALGLRQQQFRKDAKPAQPIVDSLLRTGANEFPENSGQFYQFLMNSPTPFAMLSGPEHRFTFINQPYVELIGQDTQQGILMKTVREVLPELEGQPFFAWLDEVFETGIQHIGREQLAHIRRPQGPGFDDRYFDFIYYPVRNLTGHVYGVMVQAADVTERVQTQAMSEQREETIFRQWAELEAIYSTAPIGMALLDAKTLRPLKLNKRYAELMNTSVSALLGDKGLEPESLPPPLKLLFASARAGETVHNAVVEKKWGAHEFGGHRTWLVNINPFLGPSGEVMAYTSIALEIPD